MQAVAMLRSGPVADYIYNVRDADSSDAARVTARARRR